MGLQAKEGQEPQKGHGSADVCFCTHLLGCERIAFVLSHRFVVTCHCCPERQAWRSCTAPYWLLTPCWGGKPRWPWLTGGATAKRNSYESTSRCVSMW
jgi:hypothetical protein